MKKLILYIFIATFALSSCNYLDKEPDTEKTLESVFENSDDVYGWLGRVYSSIPDPYWGFSRHIGWEVLGDDQTPSERWRAWNWPIIPYIFGDWTPSSWWDANWWIELPRSIREGEIFIRNVKPLPDQGIYPEDVDLMKAECRFLIAYYWSLLANTYGPVPFEPHKLISTDTPVSEMLTPQKPYQEIIDWCDQELKEVATLLPAKYGEARKYGRATSIMCLAVRARMLLFAASPLVNGNPDYADHVSKTGEALFPTTYDPTKWRRAANACKELIDAAHENGYKLYKEYNEDKTTLDPFASIQNLYLTRFDEGNTEILFPRPGGCDYGEYEKHICPAKFGGSGGYGVTQSLVDAFFMRNGLPIDDPNSEYVEEGFSADDDIRGYKWEEKWNDGNTTRAGTYKMYCNREPRFYVSVSYNGSWFNQEQRPYEFFNGQLDNPFTHDAPQNGYLIRKKVSPDTNCREGSFKSRPGIVYRLGEAYLNYAEALNECDPGNPQIIEMLNLIRERAGVRGYTTGASDWNYIHVDTDQDSMREIIRRERRVELFSDGTRYDDLRRWRLAEEKLNGPFYGMDYRGKNAEDFYKRTVYQTRTYRKEFYFFPVPKDELDKNINLVQNPYWK